MAEGPPLKLLMRGPEGATLWISGADGLKSFTPSKLRSVPCLGAQFNKDGSLLATWQGDVVSIFNARTEEKLTELGAGEGAVHAVSISPLGTYVQVFHKSSGAEGEKNLKLYELSSGRVVLALGQKQFNRDRWPSLQFSDDESVALRTVTNEVQLYSPADFASGLARRLRVPGVTSASLSPGPTPVVATFVPEAKGAPGCVRIHALPACAPGEATEGGPPLARRSFFRVTYVRFRWNAPGTALLLLASADIDATNQSYYGESTLHFLRVDGSVEGAVPLAKEGPVHDVAWSPRGSEFIAVYGFMPARVTLFSDSLKALHELPGGALNTARWNPFGRFLALAGFGNLPGDVTLLDRKADGKCKPMAETRLANSVSIDWSPCGRALLTATTAPRLQVDNGFRVVRYTGEVLFTHTPQGQLYAAEWQPAPAGAFADRPQTPGAAAAAKAAPSVVAAAKAPAYRPPGAASRGEPVGGGPTFSLAREVQPFLKPGAAGPRPPPAGPPGAEFVDAAKANKNAKKRAAAKAKAAAAAAEGVAGMSVK